MLLIKDKLVNRIRGHGQGWVFSGKDFLDLAERAATDQALRRLCLAGTIRKVCRGVYDYPRVSKALAMQAPPDLDQAARALARNRGWRIQASGPWAANLLGLSTQVPAKIVYLTDGRRCQLKIGNSTILFKPTARKDLQDDRIGLVIQAIKALGEANLDAAMLAKIRGSLTPAQRRQLPQHQYVTGWVYETLKRISADPGGGA